MERTAINPVAWSTGLGFDQAELVKGHQRLLVCSAQDAMDADGAPQHPGDMAARSSYLSTTWRSSWPPPT